MAYQTWRVDSGLFVTPNKPLAESIGQGVAEWLSTTEHTKILVTPGFHEIDVAAVIGGKLERRRFRVEVTEVAQ